MEGHLLTVTQGRYEVAKALIHNGINPHLITARDVELSARLMDATLLQAEGELDPGRRWGVRVMFTDLPEDDD